MGLVDLLQTIDVSRKSGVLELRSASGHGTITFGEGQILDLFAGLGLAQAMSRSSPIVGNAALFNVSGHPALSVPAGLSAQGWPIGAQLAGPTGREDLLLALGAQLEQALCWPGIAPDYR